MKKELNTTALFEISKGHKDLNFLHDMEMYYGINSDGEKVFFNYKGEAVTTLEKDYNFSYFPEAETLITSYNDTCTMIGKAGKIIFREIADIRMKIQEQQMIVLTKKIGRKDGVKGNMCVFEFFDFFGKKLFSVENVRTDIRIVSLKFGFIMFNILGSENTTVEEDAGLKSLWSLKEKKKIWSFFGSAGIEMLLDQKGHQTPWIVVETFGEKSVGTYTIYDVLGHKMLEFPSRRNNMFVSRLCCFSTHEGDVVGIMTEDKLWSVGYLETGIMDECLYKKLSVKDGELIAWKIEKSSSC